MPLVPIWAAAVGLVVEVWLPRGRALDVSGAVRVLACVAALAAGVHVLDAGHRNDPQKYWYRLAPTARLPPAIVDTLRTYAQQFGWKSYVGLNSQNTPIILDTPLPPATRFLTQYQYSFTGPDSPHGEELVQALMTTDLVAEDVGRLRLDRELEHRIRSVLNESFRPILEWGGIRFYARADRPGPPTEIAPGKPRRRPFGN
jgi:hypothetical protein